MNFTRICGSDVARHPKPKAVVQFYGAEFFGQLPVASYGYLFSQIFNAGYSLIVTPFQFTTNHVAVANTLLKERDCIRQAIPEFASLPLLWVGHSLGCKFIAMLEAATTKDNQFLLAEKPNQQGILDEPSLLIAPVFGDNDDLIPFIGGLLDLAGVGIKPTRADLRALVVSSELFTLCSMLGFTGDGIAGNQTGNPNRRDVPWLIQTLRSKKNFSYTEIAGSHIEPNGDLFGDKVIGVTLLGNLIPFPTFDVPPRLVDTTVVTRLNALLDIALLLK
jgi:hypothetical protein